MYRAKSHPRAARGLSQPDSLHFPLKELSGPELSGAMPQLPAIRPDKKDNARFSEMIPQESARDDLTAGECRLNIRLARLHVGHPIWQDKPGYRQISPDVAGLARPQAG